MNKDFKNVTFSQLSDSAFIWSKDISDIIIIANKFMTKAISRGILCRGGLTYGEIIETNQNHELGRFIVGKAVTEAVKLEGIAKGARILIDEDFPSKLWEVDSVFSDKITPLFVPFTNPLDYMIYDEFKWYLVSNLSKNIEDLRFLSFDTRLNYTKDRLKLAAQVRCSPSFGWNARNVQGLIQLRATINFMTESDLLGILHNFDWNDVIEKRSQIVVDTLKKSIENDDDYREKVIVEENEMLSTNDF